MPVESTPSLLTLRFPPPRMTRRLIGVGAMGVVVLIWSVTRGSITTQKPVNCATRSSARSMGVFSKADLCKIVPRSELI